MWVRSVRSTTGYNSGNITLTSSPATQKTVFVEVTASNPAGCSVQDSLRIFNFGYNKCRIDSSGVAQREYLRGTIYGRDTLGLRKWGVDGNIAMIIKDNGDTLKYRLDFIR